MILLIAIVIGLAATILRARLSHRTLKLKNLRWEWLVFISVIPQIFLFQIPITAKLIPESLVPIAQIISMVGLLVFTSVNLLSPGFWALGLGLISNFLVIVLNGGWMPISVDTLTRMVPDRSPEFWIIGTRLGFSKDRILSPGEINLIWLSDRLVLPQWIPLHIAFSLGDIFITIGTLILLWSLSNPVKEKE
jgi:hypothetical protein